MQRDIQLFGLLIEKILPMSHIHNHNLLVMCPFICSRIIIKTLKNIFYYGALQCVPVCLQKSEENLKELSLHYMAPGN